MQQAMAHPGTLEHRLFNARRFTSFALGKRDRPRARALAAEQGITLNRHGLPVAPKGARPDFVAPANSLLIINEQGQGNC